jgi:hypothetical protein
MAISGHKRSFLVSQVYGDIFNGSITRREPQILSSAVSQSGACAGLVFVI